MRELIGGYRYELRRGDVRIAIEEARIEQQAISVRRCDSVGCPNHPSPGHRR